MLILSHYVYRYPFIDSTEGVDIVDGKNIKQMEETIAMLREQVATQAELISLYRINNSSKN